MTIWNRGIRAAAYIAVLALAFGFQGLSGQPAESADQQALRARFEAMVEAFDSGDNEAAIAFYAESFVRLPPGWAAVTSHEVLLEEMRTYTAEYETSLDEFIIRRVEVSGDLGHTLASYTETSTPRAGGAAASTSGRWAIMWRRIDGVWRVTAEIWNLAPAN